MGTTTKKDNKDGTTTYKVAIRIKGHARVNASFDNLSRAQVWERRMEAEIREAVRKGSALSAKSFYREDFKQAIESFLKTQPKTSYHHQHLKTALAHLPKLSMGDLRRSVVKQYVDKMLATNHDRGRHYKASTIHHHLTGFNEVYKWLAAQYDVTPEPGLFSSALLGRNWRTRRFRRLEEWEQRALWKDFRSRGPDYRQWRLLVRFALETAGRLQEMFLATWDEFDMEARKWTIPPEHDKTRKGRGVPLSRHALRVLRFAKAISQPGDGGPFVGFHSTSNVSTWFLAIVKRNGMTNISLHDLRHEAITRMVLHKRLLSVFEIMHIVGHGDLDTLNIYANLRVDDLIARFHNAPDPKVALMKELEQSVRSHVALLAALDGKGALPSAAASAAPPTAAPAAPLGVSFVPSRVLYSTSMSIPALSPALPGKGWSAPRAGGGDGGGDDDRRTLH